jgi:hypothetical protein
MEQVTPPPPDTGEDDLVQHAAGAGGLPQRHPLRTQKKGNWSNLFIHGNGEESIPTLALLLLCANPSSGMMLQILVGDSAREHHTQHHPVQRAG